MFGPKGYCALSRAPLASLLPPVQHAGEVTAQAPLNQLGNFGRIGLEENGGR